MHLTSTAQIRLAIRALPRAEWGALAQASGVPRSTIEKIAYGVTNNPSFDATVAIAEALRTMARADITDPVKPSPQKAAA